MPRDAGYADAVISYRTDRSRHVGPMKVFAIVPERLISTIKEVPSIDIVHKTVPVVINTVARNLKRINPRVGGQILMSQLRARVQHRYDDVVTSGGDIPGSRGIDVW